MLTEQEQQEDYLKRVGEASPKIDAILKEHHLNLGAQFDPTQWPKALKPVPIYTDMRDYAAEAPIESPIQQEDLETPEASPEDPL